MSCFAGLVSTPSPSGFADRGKGRGRVYENITETVGNTPCVKISDAIARKAAPFTSLGHSWQFLQQLLKVTGASTLPALLPLHKSVQFIYLI